MKTIVFFTIFLFFGLWALLGSYLLGYFPMEYVPDNIRSLVQPKSTTDLGDSLAILDGIFTSVAITLGLVAILLQGKELKEATKAQTDQARALALQISQQTESNRLSAYTARLQFLIGESDRLGGEIDRLFKEINEISDGDKKAEKQRIVDNTINLRKKYREDARNIDKYLSGVLGQTT